MFTAARSGFEISLGLAGAMALWLGLMRVGERAGMVELLARAADRIVTLLTERHGLVRAEQAGREEDAPGLVLSHPGQDIGADGGGDQAQLHLGQAEARGISGNGDVGHRHHAHAAAEGIARYLSR